jgi:hypothetical protein
MFETVPGENRGIVTELRGFAPIDEVTADRQVRV